MTNCKYVLHFWRTREKKTERVSAQTALKNIAKPTRNYCASPQRHRLRNYIPGYLPDRNQKPIYSRRRRSTKTRGTRRPNQNGASSRGYRSRFSYVQISLWLSTTDDVFGGLVNAMAGLCALVRGGLMERQFPIVPEHTCDRHLKYLQN